MDFWIGDRDINMISIIMPAFNAEKYIIQAIESVVQQTYTEWELIIVEDCSSDATRHVLRKYINVVGDKELRKKLYLLENRANEGAAYCRNRGIEAAHGEWIAFLDSDDAWRADKLEKQMDLWRKESACALIFTGSAFMDEDGSPLNGELHVPQKISYGELLKQNVISCSSVLIRKELLEDCTNKDGDIFPNVRRLHQQQMHEDFPVWLTALKKCEYAYGVDEPLLIYRRQSSSQSGDKKKSAKMTWNVYRYIGLSVWKCMYYFVWYAYRSVRKYRGIG